MKTYFIQGSGGGNIKIGRATDPEKRLKDLQCGSSVPLILIATLNDDRESELHSKFSAHRQHGEWFAPSPGLAKFIEAHATAHATTAPAPVANVPIQIDEWAKRELVVITGGDWIGLNELDDWATTIATHFDAEGCSANSEEEEEEDEWECQCESCCFHRAVSILSNINELDGFAWRREDRMLCAMFSSRPGFENGGIISELMIAFDDADAASISLKAISYTSQGAFVDQQLFARWIGASVTGTGSNCRLTESTPEGTVRA